MDSASSADEYGPVSEFYRGKSIFMTGGTGFVGKVLIEKLLWSCPGIEKIYVLVRLKKNKDVTTRFAEMLNSKVFERLRNSRPSELKKIVPVMGDLAEPSLMLSPSDKEVLLQTVSVVFHVGATVRFNDPFKKCIAANVKSTKNICELCHGLLNLQALVFVSTAYSNCDRTEIEEVVYSLPNEPNKIIDLVDEFDEDTIGSIAPKLLGGRPNVYTYSKALAESILERESEVLPAAIVRPSSVTASAQEPTPGWTDSWGGLAPYGAAMYAGLVHWVFAKPHAVADVVPVDMVANFTICTAWHTATKSSSSQIGVYNLTSGLQNPITWKEMLDLCRPIARDNPIEGPTLPRFVFMQSNWSIYRIQAYCLERLPLIAVDWVAKITGKRTNYANLHRKLANGLVGFRYFVAREWKFKDDNVRSLHCLLEKTDQETFPFLAKSIDWKEYAYSHVFGIRHYLLKNDPKSLKRIQKQNSLLPWIKILLVLFVLIYLARIVQTAVL